MLGSSLYVLRDEESFEALWRGNHLLIPEMLKAHLNHRKPWAIGRCPFSSAVSRVTIRWVTMRIIATRL